MTKDKPLTQNYDSDKENSEIDSDIRVLKVISIVQLMMAVIFFTLGMSDRFQVRHIYTSFLFTPCWIAALVSTVLRCNHDP